MKLKELLEGLGLTLMAGDLDERECQEDILVELPDETYVDIKEVFFAEKNRTIIRLQEKEGKES
jgi:hypothetical protein